MKTLIINDLHLGVQRSGGTTISSAVALRQFAQGHYEALLRRARFLRVDRLIVNGDLTDQYSIPLSDALDMFQATREFVEENKCEVIWAEGNHDLSKDSSRLGTVGFIGQLLQAVYGEESFKLVSRPTTLSDGMHIIPHLANQTLFDEALADVPNGTKYLFLHCNYDNTFAGRQDHSLNITRDQARELAKRDLKIIIGHEHQGRDLMSGKVVIVGNQFPTSIADCLPHGDAQKDGKKYCLLIDGDDVQRIETWDPDGDEGWYGEVDWRELKDTTESGRGFVRVSGTATALEATEVIKQIAAFRQRSISYVVTNAVKVEKPEGMEDLPDSIEDIKQVDVMELLYEMLDAEQAAKVREIIGEAEVAA